MAIINRKSKIGSFNIFKITIILMYVIIVADVILIIFKVVLVNNEVYVYYTKNIVLQIISIIVNVTFVIYFTKTTHNYKKKLQPYIVYAVIIVLLMALEFWMQYTVELSNPIDYPISNLWLMNVANTGSTGDTGDTGDTGGTGDTSTVS